MGLPGGHSEREAVLVMLGEHRRPPYAQDKDYDTVDVVATCRALGVTPHVAQNTSGRRSTIDGRTTRHAGYVLSLKIRAGSKPIAAGSRQGQACDR